MNVDISINNRQAEYMSTIYYLNTTQFQYGLKKRDLLDVSPTEARRRSTPRHSDVSLQLPKQANTENSFTSELQFYILFCVFIQFASLIYETTFTKRVPYIEKLISTSFFNKLIDLSFTYV